MRIIRFAMMRVVSVLRNEPIATSSGPRVQNVKLETSSSAKEAETTLRILSLSKQSAGLVAKGNRPIDGSHARDTVSEPTFKLVDVIHSFPTSASELAIDRIYFEASRATAKDERILNGGQHISENRKPVSQNHRTLERTGASYSVLRWTEKLRTEILCSCCSRPNMVNGCLSSS